MNFKLNFVTIGRLALEKPSLAAAPKLQDQVDPSPDLSYTGVGPDKGYLFGVSYTGARVSRFFYYPSALENVPLSCPKKIPRKSLGLPGFFV